MNVEQLAARARNDGHELLLQIPMEPFDYPDNDPGPQTLLTSLDAGQNIDRLHRLMSRFQGYVGISNYMGARFTGEAPIKGLVIASEGRFEAIVPGERVVTSSSMWLMDACISSALVTMELTPDNGGTRLTCTFQGAFFENSDGPQMREMGWQILLDQLGKALAE